MPHQTGPLAQALEGDADGSPGQIWLASHGQLRAPTRHWLSLRPLAWDLGSGKDWS